MILTELQWDLAEQCPCSCCKDAITRNNTGRGLKDACNCGDYQVKEQCDCWFCAMGIS